MLARTFLSVTLLLLSVPLFAADDPTRVFSGSEKPTDRRLGKPIDLNTGYFPFTPPTNKHAWEERRVALRRQIQVAEGLWPMPERGPVKATIHGAIDRDGYTVEKVFFASLPGHYVTGNLYRPTGKTGKRPAILSPHGHWPNGRFYDAGEKVAMASMKPTKVGTVAEKTIEGARYPLQARCS